MENLEEKIANLAIQMGLPFFISGPKGEIHGANSAFCEMVGYTEFELKKRGWIIISVADDDLVADQQTLEDLVEGNLFSYSVVKSFISKSGSPITGHLQVIRHPQSKELINKCLCWFVPSANGSKAALDLVVAYIEKHTNATHMVAEKIAAMSQDLLSKKAESVGQRLWDNLGEWALQNPKTAGALFLILLSLNPAPIVTTWVTRMGWLPAQPVQIEMKDPKTGSVDTMNGETFDSLVGLHNQR